MIYSELSMSQIEETFTMLDLLGLDLLNNIFFFDPKIFYNSVARKMRDFVKYFVSLTIVLLVYYIFDTRSHYFEII